MDIVIGIQFVGRELRLEVEEDSADTVREAVDEALDSEQRIFWLTDKNGRQVGVPTEKLGYVEIASEKSDRQVGFAVGEQRN